MTQQMIETYGLDPATWQRLAAAQISSVEHLLARTCTPTQRYHLARQLGVSVGRLARWVVRADLMRLSDLQSAQAYLLELCGVGSCQELQYRLSGRLYARMQQINNEQMVLDMLPSMEQLERWMTEAGELSERELVIGG